MMVQPPRFRDRPEVTTVTSNETRDQEENEDTRASNESLSSSGEYGVEMVLSGTTSDTQRAKDMILPASLRGGGRKQEPSSPFPYQYISTSSTSRQYVSTLRTDSDRSTSSSVSNSTEDKQRISEGSKRSWQHQSQDSRNSVSVKRSTNNYRQQPDSTASQKSLLDDVSESSSASGVFHRSMDDDSVWRAAKRGDLMALKDFHSRGDINWAAPDQYGKIPLYYACHSGAIVDINVLHFLLWVTPIKGAEDLDKCKNKKNKEVMKILDDFEHRGYKTPMQFEIKADYKYKVPLKQSSRRRKNNVDVSASKQWTT